jgi:hypothetical protein
VKQESNETRKGFNSPNYQHYVTLTNQTKAQGLHLKAVQREHAVIQAQHAKLKEQAGVNDLTLERQEQVEQLKKQLADT